MGFNYGKERYRTEKEFARFARACRGAGMPEDAIAEMYQYDREALNSDRRYYTHTQPFAGAAFCCGDDEGYEEGRSPLYKNCLAQCSVQLEIHYSGCYGWLEDIDTPALVLWLKALSDDDLELLTLIVFDGRNQSEVAREWHRSEAAISKRMITLLAAYAQEESYNVSENQKWRIRRMFEQGRPNTGRMLGYRLKDGVLQIVPGEAGIVKMIFNDYLSGMGRNLIVKKLIRMGVPTLSGGQWRESTVLGILTNEKYTGDMLLQKTYSVDHLTKKQMINHGERRRYYIENSHEPIIDKETFAKVQQELARRAEKFQPNAPFSGEYPFTGLIRCGFCGGYFRRKITASGTKYAKPVWICPTFNTYGKDICSAQQIPEKILIEKTSEVLGTADWDRETLLSYISEIWVPEHNLLMYVFRDGHTEEVAWQNPSRRESWSDEMKQTARERQLRMIERRRKDDGTD